MIENILVPALALIVLLGTLVLFHEFGHFAVAKLFRVRVEEFAFGFGPKWIRLFKRGDTEYTIHPVPLGGFVKLSGEQPGEAELPGSFNTKPWYQRFLVYLAGPIMSFVLAYLVFILLGLAYGIPVATNQVDMVKKGSIAEHIGLKPGDRIQAIDGTRMTSGEQVVQIIHGSLGRKLTLTIDRKDQTFTVTAVPAEGELGPGVGLLGFSPASAMRRAGLVESAKYGTLETYGFAKMTVGALFSRNVGKNVGGPLAIADATRQSVKRGLEGFLFLMAMLSLSLGIVNLLPIPVVDGGQMWLVVAEGIKGGKLSQRTLEIAQMIGIATIGLIFVAIMFLDLHRVFTGQLFK